MIRLIAVVLFAVGALGHGDHTASSGPRLSVSIAGGWVEWWSAANAPRIWRAADPTLGMALSWTEEEPGLEWAELRLAGDGEAWRTRLIVVRLDPGKQRLRLRTRLQADLRAGAWTVDSAPPGSSLALNAGQFSGIVPWGWVVLDGREIRPPGVGPLSTAVAVGTDGRVHWLPPDSIASFRRDHAVVQALQSYPTLLVGDGEIPIPLREPGFPVQLNHRDARLAIGEGRDGSLMIALTRFDGLDGTASGLPFGLTTPEMAAVMGALGCRRAVALDGGLSAQLRIGGADGQTRAWHGLRAVPMGLVATPVAPPEGSP